MATLGEFTEYDTWIKWLNEGMRYKLRVNAHKGFMGDVPVERLLEFLKGEIPELEDAIARGSQIEMILEAADIANFALGVVIAAVKGQQAPGVSQELKPEKIEYIICKLCGLDITSERSCRGGYLACPHSAHFRAT